MCVCKGWGVFFACLCAFAQVLTSNCSLTTYRWHRKHSGNNWKQTSKSCPIRVMCCGFFFLFAFFFCMKSRAEMIQLLTRIPQVRSPLNFWTLKCSSMHLPPQNPAFCTHFSITIAVSQIHSLLLLFFKQKTNDIHPLVKMNLHNKEIEPLSNAQQFRSLHYSTKIPKIVEVPNFVFLVDD